MAAGWGGSGDEAEEGFGVVAVGEDGFGQGSGAGVEELEGQALETLLRSVVGARSLTS